METFRGLLRTDKRHFIFACHALRKVTALSRRCSSLRLQLRISRGGERFWYHWESTHLSRRKGEPVFKEEIWGCAWRSWVELTALFCHKYIVRDLKKNLKRNIKTNSTWQHHQHFPQLLKWQYAPPVTSTRFRRRHLSLELTPLKWWNVKS